MNAPPNDRSGRWRAVVPVVALAVVVAIAAVWWLRDDGPPAPVALDAAGPVAGNLDELVALSDVVVEAQVVSVIDGRAISDPEDPEAGIRTQLAQLEVTVVHLGGAPGGEVGGEADVAVAPGTPLIVEQESTLLDGTPVVVNGLDPLRPGDGGFFFLVEGDGDEFPYTALVGDQGWLPVVGGTVQARTTGDPVGVVWNGRDRDELAAALRPG